MAMVAAMGRPSSSAAPPLINHPGIERKNMPSKIEDYGLIGNTFTSALVSRTGSIDWLCAPRFDSDACFTALIGYDEHGRWTIRPTVPIREVKQQYEGDTLVLSTEFVCEGGRVRLVDFMPPSDERCDVIRYVEGVAGEVPLEMILEPKFGYGADRPYIVPNGGNPTYT